MELIRRFCRPLFCLLFKPFNLTFIWQSPMVANSCCELSASCLQGACKPVRHRCECNGRRALTGTHGSPVRKKERGIENCCSQAWLSSQKVNAELNHRQCGVFCSTNLLIFPYPPPAAACSGTKAPDFFTGVGVVRSPDRNEVGLFAEHYFENRVEFHLALHQHMDTTGY